MTEQLKKSSTDQLSEEQVIDYLKSHPNFFVHNDSLLKELKLPHDSGKAISLGERQVQVFREHRDELKAQLNDLISVARQNDQIFEKSKRLLLNLLDVKSLDEIELVVKTAFEDDPNIDYAKVIIVGDPEGYPASALKVIKSSEASEHLGALVDSQNAVCGRFTDKQLQCLFSGSAKEVGSAAVIPLRNSELLGVFALGSKSEAHFDSSMGSLFLSYISDFIARILPDLLQRSRTKKAVDKIPSLLD